MLAYIVRHLFALIPILLLLTAFVFFIFHFLPGGPINMMVPPDKIFDEEVRRTLEEELGLDKPVLVQYTNWLWRALHGDLGESIYSQLSIWQLIMERFPATLYLALAAMVLAIVAAIPMGTVAALRTNIMPTMGHRHLGVWHHGTEFLARSDKELSSKSPASEQTYGGWVNPVNAQLIDETRCTADRDNASGSTPRPKSSSTRRPHGAHYQRSQPVGRAEQSQGTSPQRGG